MNPNAHRLHDYLLQHHTDGLVVQTQEEMAQGLGMPQRTVSDALSRLKEAGCAHRNGNGKWQVGMPRQMQGEDLSGSNLAGLNLSGCDLRGADLSGADLRSCILNGADLSWAHLTDTLLGETVWKKNRACFADFSGADLTKANLSSGIFTRARFHHAHIEEFDGAEFDGTDLLDLKGIANNHTIVAALVMSLLPSREGRVVGSRIETKRVGCWQECITDVGGFFPDIFLAWHQAWDDLYGAGKLDFHAYLQFKLESLAMRYRLEGRDTDEIMWPLADQAPSKRWHWYFLWQTREGLHRGLRFSGVKREEMEEETGSIKEADWERDVKAELRPDGPPDMPADKRRDLDNALGKASIPSVEQLAVLLKEAA